ncbi:MAG: hypothetical protein WA988_08485, partial [Candidatus Nanopelagicales bacterium]
DTPDMQTERPDESPANDTMENHAVDAFNRSLGELEQLLYTLSSARGISLTYSQRKDVTTFFVGDGVTVELAQQSDRQTGHVAVANSSQFRMITDPGQLLAPPPTVLLALVMALLDHNAVSPAED